MSQVIVTEDRLKEKRQKSAAQEQRIGRDDLDRFRRSDVTKQDPAATVLGLVLMPLFGVWTLVSWVILEVVTQVLFKPLGKLFGGKRSLITGDKPS